MMTIGCSINAFGAGAVITDLYRSTTLWIMNRKIQSQLLQKQMKRVVTAIMISIAMATMCVGQKCTQDGPIRRLFL